MAKPLFACHAAFLCPFETEKRKNRKFPPAHVYQDMYHFDAVWQRNLRSGKNRNANHSKKFLCIKIWQEGITCSPCRRKTVVVQYK